MVDELELISRLREEVPLGSADRAEHVFRTSIRGRGARPVRRHGFVPQLRLRAKTSVSLAAVAAAGLAAGLILLPGNTALPGNASGASPAAAQLLDKLANAAGAQPNPLVHDSQFMYIKDWGAGSTCMSPHPANRHKVVSIPGDCVPGKPAEAQSWYSVASLCRTDAFLVNGKLTRFSFKAVSADPAHFSCGGNMNYPTYRFMQALPTDPHALLRLIQQRDGHPTEYWWAFSTIGTLLDNEPPPSVTAALYRATALIPGVTVVPDATDTIGRPGIAVAFTFQGIRKEWIFSKRTLQYLGACEVSTANGALVSQGAIEQHAIVDHVGQIPG